MVLAVLPVSAFWLGCSQPQADAGDGRSPGRLTPAEIERLETGLSEWVRDERDRHRDRALPLSSAQRRLFEPYFSRSVLDGARIAVVERFRNPEVFRLFDRLGEPYPLDLAHASGLALIDTILVAGPVARNGAARFEPSEGLLFHELVHLTQYEELGFEEYMRRYVAGWAREDFEYRRIAQERQAYALTVRFLRARRSETESFQVPAEVRRLFELD